MGLFILRRLGVMILTALCLTFIVFFLTNLYPNLEKVAKFEGNVRMTDEQVAEIYALGRDSLSGGNPTFQVQAYPFRMTPENFARYRDNENLPYWRNLQTGFLSSEVTRGPADWDACGGEYVFNARSASGLPLDARAACPVLERDATIVAEINVRLANEMAAFDTRVASLEQTEQRRAEEEARAEATRLAIEQRTAVVNDAVNGVGQSINSFINGLFGGGAPAPQSTAVELPTGTPPLAAPIPMPRIVRS